MFKGQYPVEEPKKQTIAKKVVTAVKNKVSKKK